MIEPKFDHSVVSMDNKMFVIDHNTLSHFEIYDNVSKKFSLINIKPPNSQIGNLYYCKTLCFSNKLVFFVDDICYNKLKIFVYNVDDKRLIFKNVFIVQVTDSTYDKHPKS